MVDGVGGNRWPGRSTQDYRYIYISTCNFSNHLCPCLPSVFYTPCYQNIRRIRREYQLQPEPQKTTLTRSMVLVAQKQRRLVYSMDQINFLAVPKEVNYQKCFLLSEDFPDILRTHLLIAFYFLIEHFFPLI